jgi:hypothetical protein
MSLTNGSNILASDLTALTTAALALIQADNAQVPAAYEWHSHFPNLVTGTAAERRKSIVVAPFDCFVEVIAAEGNDHTAASTLTVSLYGDGALQSFPQAPASGTTTPFLSVSGTVGAGINKLSRLLYDGTKSSTKAGPSTSQAVRLIPRGTTLTLTVSTTSVAAASSTHVAVVLREFFARE